MADHPQSVRSAVVNFADQDPKRGERRALAARGALWALGLGVLAFILQSVATGTPTWAYFHNPDGELKMNLQYVDSFIIKFFFCTFIIFSS